MMGGRGDSQIDFYALGVSAMPYTIYDYYSMQNMMSSVNQAAEDDSEEEQFYGQEE